MPKVVATVGFSEAVLYRDVLSLVAVCSFGFFHSVPSFDSAASAERLPVLLLEPVLASRVCCVHADEGDRLFEALPPVIF